MQWLLDLDTNYQDEISSPWSWNCSGPGLFYLNDQWRYDSHRFEPARTNTPSREQTFALSQNIGIDPQLLTSIAESVDASSSLSSLTSLQSSILPEAIQQADPEVFPPIFATSQRSDPVSSHIDPLQSASPSTSSEYSKLSKTCSSASDAPQLSCDFCKVPFNHVDSLW